MKPKFQFTSGFKTCKWHRAGNVSYPVNFLPESCQAHLYCPFGWLHSPCCPICRTGVCVLLSPQLQQDQYWGLEGEEKSHNAQIHIKLEASYFSDNKNPSWGSFVLTLLYLTCKAMAKLCGKKLLSFFKKLLWSTMPVWLAACTGSAQLKANLQYQVTGKGLFAIWLPSKLLTWKSAHSCCDAGCLWHSSPAAFQKKYHTSHHHISSLPSFLSLFVPWLER